MGTAAWDDASWGGTSWGGTSWGGDEAAEAWPAQSVRCAAGGDAAAEAWPAQSWTRASTEVRHSTRVHRKNLGQQRERQQD